MPAPSYNPTDWVDYVTPVDEVHLDKIEQGLAALANYLGVTVDPELGNKIDKRIIDAKGDLIAGSADDTVVRVPVGPNGYVLTADLTQTGGLKWGPPVVNDANNVFDVRDYGAVAGGLSRNSKLHTTGGSTTVTIDAADTGTKFSAADVGKTIVIAAAATGGLNTLVTTITGYVGPSQITVQDAPGSTYAGASMTSGVWWDNTITTNLTAFQAAINACIALGGGTVYVPAGEYIIPGVLDFSALGGDLHQLTFQGAGVGCGYVNGTAPVAATLLVCTGGSTALKAYGPNIYGIAFKDFAVYCPNDIGAANFAIDWSGVVSQGEMSGVLVQLSRSGTANVGNGVRIANPSNGQIRVDRLSILAANSTTSEGFRLSTEAVGGVSAVNSGNIVIGNLLASVCTGIAIRVMSGGVLLNSVTFNSPKAVSYGNGIGFQFDGGFNYNLVMNTPHAEGGGVGYYLNGCHGVVLVAPLAFGNNNADGLEGFKLVGSGCVGNRIIAGVVEAHQYGASLATACAGNHIDISSDTGMAGGAVATLFKPDSGTGANVPRSNVKWNGRRTLPGQQIQLAARTTVVSATGVGFASATNVMSQPNTIGLACDGVQIWRIEFECPWATVNGVLPVSGIVCLQSGTDGVSFATSVARLCQFDAKVASASYGGPLRGFYEYVPPSGLIFFQVRVYLTAAGTFTLNAGTGGSDSAFGAMILRAVCVG